MRNTYSKIITIFSFCSGLMEKVKKMDVKNEKKLYDTNLD